MQFENDTAQDLVFLGTVPGELAELRIDKLSLENAESELPPQKNAQGLQCLRYRNASTVESIQHAGAAIVQA